ncbi:unnamed protein product [[Candida] boidinii]|nr:unnamed protein product [[Candida] boidinii]
MSDGYSGHDIAVVVRDALMQPIRKIQSATHFKKVVGTREVPTASDAAMNEGDDNEDDSSKPVNTVTEQFEQYTPCSPGDVGAVEMNWMDLHGDELKEPDLTLKDFIKAVKTNKPTVNQTDLDKFIDFTNDFGSEGN